jgi:ribulose-5-phosphate 4-epimerase/fuculose-1-phosphate aldolase
MLEPTSVLASASLALVHFGEAASNASLLLSTCGNVSLRLDADRFIISATGAAIGCLATHEVSVIAIADGTRLSGAKPSMESELHRRAYLARPEITAVLHAQSRAATVLACHVDPPRNLDYIPEIPAYVRAHTYVPYAAPGSEALAESVTRAVTDPDVTIVQLVNHGQVVLGETWEKAIRRAVFFEHACWMALQGVPLKTIPAADVAALRDYGRRG